MANRSLSIALALSGTFVLECFALASSGNYNQAVSDYNAGKYANALAEFEACQSASPSNVMVHYYKALCLQGMGQLERAKEEFRFVAERGDQRLKGLAQTGLSQLSKAKTMVSHASTPSPSSASRSSGKVKRILEFYADWCGPCKAFAPVFEEVKGKFRDVSFECYNVDDQSSQSIRAQYQFDSIPRIIFLDGSGKLLLNDTPQREVESFEQQISQFR